MKIINDWQLNLTDFQEMRNVVERNEMNRLRLVSRYLFLQ